MKQFLIYGLIAIFYMGCGSNSSSNGSSSNTNTDNTPTFEDYKYQQWYLKKDESFYSQYDIDDNAHIHGSDEIFETYTGKNIKVAVIDTGFDVNHPELVDNIISAYIFDEDGEYKEITQAAGDEYHGTAVAGIIASSNKIQGVSPNVDLILIEMPEYITDDVVIKMFDKAIVEGAQVINCSWGTGDVSNLIRDYINDIANSANNNQGVSIVFAAGNDSIPILNDESSIKNVIAVGSTDEENLRVTQYSNYGKDLDIVAPGGYDIPISTLDNSGNNGATDDGYLEFDEMYTDAQGYSHQGFIGTSASAPIVSGALALFLEKYPNMTSQEIREKLKTSTDLVGQNTPYIDDMVSSSSVSPTISGLLGTTGYDEFQIRLRNSNSLEYFGPYDISSIDGENQFEVVVTDDLDEGLYQVLLIGKESLTSIYAVDENFEINTSKETVVDKNVRFSSFYGNGKINLTKLLK